MRRNTRKSAAQLPPRRRQTESSQRATEAELRDRYAFRRNRTLTGSAASSVVAAGGAASAQLKSPRLQAHELAEHRRRLGVVLSIVMLVGVVVLILVQQFTASPIVRSKNVAVSLDATMYEGLIQDYLKTQPLERFRFSLNTPALLGYMQKHAPEVQTIDVGGFAGIGKTSFTVVPRTPVASWTIGKGERYVDRTGTAFSRNYYKAPQVEIIDESGVQAVSGQAVASDRFLGFVGRVVGIAKTHGYTVTRVAIPEGTTRQIALIIKGLSYRVIVSIDRPAGGQMEDASRAIKWLKSHSTTPEYLDVRVSGRAFYK